jgi:hypothetical protein
MYQTMPYTLIHVLVMSCNVYIVLHCPGFCTLLALSCNVCSVLHCPALCTVLLCALSSDCRAMFAVVLHCPTYCALACNVCIVLHCPAFVHCPRTVVQCLQLSYTFLHIVHVHCRVCTDRYRPAYSALSSHCRAMFALSCTVPHCALSSHCHAMFTLSYTVLHIVQVMQRLHCPALCTVLALSCNPLLVLHCPA